MTVAAHIVGGLGDLHALPLEDREHLSGEEAAGYIYGTQWFCIGVATYILFIWSLKLNMLFLYQRVVKGLWVEKFLKPAMILVGVTFIIIYLILFTACRPYYRMWIVFPDQGRESSIFSWVGQTKGLAAPTHLLTRTASDLPTPVDA